MTLPKGPFIRFGKFDRYGSSRMGLGKEWQQETGKMLEGGLSVLFVTPVGKIRDPGFRQQDLISSVKKPRYRSCAKECYAC